jgi:hypothetical protein
MKSAITARDACSFNISKDWANALLQLTNETNLSVPYFELHQNNTLFVAPYLQMPEICKLAVLAFCFYRERIASRQS